MSIASALNDIREEITNREATHESLAAQIAEVSSDLRRLRAAERALDPAPVAVTVAAKPGSTREATLTLMKDLKKATQHEVAERLGKPKNTAKTALKQLVSQGLVRATGELDRKSPVFELVEEDAPVA